MPQIISKLLSPENSIVAKFDNFGGVSVSHLQKRGANYVEVERASLKSIAFDQFDFTFSVDDAGNEAPDAGLLVETAAYWPSDWPDERATVLGGIAFPYGNEAVQAPVDNNGSTLPGRKFAGCFKKTAAGWQVTQTDVGFASAYTLTGDPKGVPMVCFALWLPKGVSGQVSFPEWSAAGGKTVRVQAAKKAVAGGKKGKGRS